MLVLGVIILIWCAIHEWFGDKGVLIALFVFGFIAMAMGF